MPFKRKCKTFKKVENDSLASTRNFLVSQEVINNLGVITDLPQFRQATQWLKEEANKTFREEEWKIYKDIPSRAWLTHVAWS